MQINKFQMYTVFIMNNLEFKLEINNIKNLVKAVSSINGLNLTSLKKSINLKYQKTDEAKNLIKKLQNKTIRLSEMIEIADILDYDVILKKRN